jgi:hypothetical protein
VRWSVNVCVLHTCLLNRNTLRSLEGMAACLEGVRLTSPSLVLASAIAAPAQLERRAHHIILRTTPFTTPAQHHPRNSNSSATLPPHSYLIREPPELNSPPTDSRANLSPTPDKAAPTSNHEARRLCFQCVDMVRQILERDGKEKERILTISLLQRRHLDLRHHNPQHHRRHVRLRQPHRNGLG